MKLRYTLALLATFAFALGGCFTTAFWMDNFRNAKTVYKDIGNDRITSFRITRTAVSNLPAGTVIMIGDENWYVLDEESSKILSKYLTAGLSHRYTLKPNVLDVTTTDPAAHTFRVYVGLSYDNPTAEDRAIIKAKQLFSEDKGKNDELSEIFYGTYYPVPATLADDGQPLRVSLPIRLRHEKTRLNPILTGLTIMATPGLLLIDAVTGAVVIPVALIANAGAAHHP